MRTDLLIAGGLASLVVGGVALLAMSQRIGRGDLVEVPSEALRNAEGVTLGQNPAVRLAVLVTLRVSHDLEGVLQGVIDSQGVIYADVPPNLKGQKFYFSLSDVVRKLPSTKVAGAYA